MPFSLTCIREEASKYIFDVSDKFCRRVGMLFTSEGYHRRSLTGCSHPVWLRRITGAQICNVRCHIGIPINGDFFISTVNLTCSNPTRIVSIEVRSTFALNIRRGSTECLRYPDWNFQSGRKLSPQVSSGPRLSYRMLQFIPQHRTNKVTTWQRWGSLVHWSRRTPIHGPSGGEQVIRSLWKKASAGNRSYA